MIPETIEFLAGPLDGFLWESSTGAWDYMCAERPSRMPQGITVEEDGDVVHVAFNDASYSYRRTVLTPGVYVYVRPDTGLGVEAVPLLPVLSGVG